MARLTECLQIVERAKRTAESRGCDVIYFNGIKRTYEAAGLASVLVPGDYILADLAPFGPALPPSLFRFR